MLRLLLGTLSIHKPHGSVRKGNIWIAGYQSYSRTPKFFLRLQGKDGLIDGSFSRNSSKY